MNAGDTFDLSEVKKDIAYFKEYKTYVFVQTKTNFYNGYIINLIEDGFMLLDDIIHIPFPVRYDSLKSPVIPSIKRGKDYNFGKNGREK